MNLEELRVAYEAWASGDVDLSRGPDGIYNTLQAQGAWSCWVACHSFLTRASAATVAEPGADAGLDEAKADAKELRHALFVARDRMRVMANWVKFSDPAAYSWSCNAITIVNAVLERGEPK